MPVQCLFQVSCMSSNTLDPGSMNNKSTLEGFFDALLHYFWHLFDLPIPPFSCFRMCFFPSPAF